MQSAYEEEKKNLCCGFLSPSLESQSWAQSSTEHRVFLSEEFGADWEHTPALLSSLPEFLSGGNVGVGLSGRPS